MSPNFPLTIINFTFVTSVKYLCFWQLVVLLININWINSHDGNDDFFVWSTKLFIFIHWNISTIMRRTDANCADILGALRMNNDDFGHLVASPALAPHGLSLTSQSVFLCFYLYFCFFLPSPGLQHTCSSSSSLALPCSQSLSSPPHLFHLTWASSLHLHVVSSAYFVFQPRLK